MAHARSGDPWLTEFLNRLPSLLLYGNPTVVIQRGLLYSDKSKTWPLGLHKPMTFSYLIDKRFAATACEQPVDAINATASLRSFFFLASSSLTADATSIDATLDVDM